MTMIRSRGSASELLGSLAELASDDDFDPAVLPDCLSQRWNQHAFHGVGCARAAPIRAPEAYLHHIPSYVHEFDARAIGLEEWTDDVAEQRFDLVPHQREE
jgi:hypothetical protein